MRVRTRLVALIGLAIILLLKSPATAQFKAERLPQTDATTKAFVPTGWQLEKQYDGDLNKDTVADAVLVLVENMPANADKENPPERQRALVALLKTADGKWQRAGTADKLLLCTRCGGAFYGVVETPVDVEIRNNVIIVHQEYGSRNVTNQTFRFRYDAMTQRFGLIGLDLTDYDRNTGLSVNESRNFLTGVMTVTKSQAQEKGPEKTLSHTRKVIAKTQKPMEAVNQEEFYIQ